MNIAFPLLLSPAAGTREQKRSGKVFLLFSTYQDLLRGCRNQRRRTRDVIRDQLNSKQDSVLKLCRNKWVYFVLSVFFESEHINSDNYKTPSINTIN